MNEKITLTAGCSVHSSEIGHYGFYYRSDLCFALIKEVTVNEDITSFADRKDSEYILITLPDDIALEMRLPSNRVWVHKSRI